MNDKPLNILVLGGGDSSEREISLLSAANVVNQLNLAGHHATFYDIRELEITDAMRQCDVVFPALHGGFGEDGRLQAAMEAENLAFVGGSADSCRIAMDKHLSKLVMAKAGISTAKYALIESIDAPMPMDLSLPMVVKPAGSGSSCGLSLVHDTTEWKNALHEAFRYDNKVLAEEYIDGVEGAIGVLRGEVLPVLEIDYPGKLYDFEAKYTCEDKTSYLCPPENIDEATQRVAQGEVLKFAEAIGNTELIRVDILIRRSDNKVFILEGNSLPDFLPNSLLVQTAIVAGYSAPEVYSDLVLAAGRRRH